MENNFNKEQNIFGQKLDSSWQNVKQIALYGFGKVAKRFIDKIIKDFRVYAIIDNAQCGKNYKGIPIISYNDAKTSIAKDTKIVVLTSQRVYSEIARLLQNDDFVEYKDFCRIEQFVREWYWTYKKQLNIIQINTAVTTYCTLNCAKCNMFMPHYSTAQKEHISLDALKKDIDTLMQFVDYVFFYTLLGGEPFLHKQLKDHIEYVATTYKDKIGKIGITTNGTLIPNDETLAIIKKYGVVISISDYSAQIPYKEKLTKLEEVLKTWDIPYSKNVSLVWKDFGFPENPFNWSEENLCAHMKTCAPLFHGINDQKLFYCHIVWSAQKAGLYTMQQSDYVDLTKLDPAKEKDRLFVSEYASGNTNNVVRLCKLCGGCGEDNTQIIPAGLQK